MQRQRHGARRRLVDAALELVGHAGKAEQPLDRQVDLVARGLRRGAGQRGQTRGKLVGADRQVLGQKYSTWLRL